MSDERAIAKYCAAAGLLLCVCSIVFAPPVPDGHSPAFNATAGFLLFAVAAGYLLLNPQRD